LLAVYAATLGEEALKALTGYEVTLSPDVLAEFLRNYPIPSVEQDYSTEVSATLTYLEDMLLPVSVDEDVSPVATFLGQNSLNPFNPATTVKYTISNDSHVNLTVYNVSGQSVIVLKDEMQSAGNYSITWNATGMPSGLYFCTLKANGIRETRKMVLVR